MATGSILLAAAGAVLPDGSTNNAAPAIQRVKSSASDPKLHFIQLAFDATTDEMCYWTFPMPSNYASAPVLKVFYKMTSATSGTIVWEGRIAATSDGDSTDLDAKALATTNHSGALTVPGTAGFLDVGSITLTNADSLAAGDIVTVQLRRDADSTNATDNATGDAEVMACMLDYTTT